MRVIACGLVLAGALAIGAAGAASAGCYRDCDAVVRPGHDEMGNRPHHRSHHRYVHKAFRSYREGYYPAIIFGDSETYRGPVYASSGQYYYGPYVSHRANFGYGGCRTAYLPYGPTWQLASNC